MAEEDLKKAILERIQKEKDSILNQAIQEQDNILREAEDEAFSLRQDYLKEIKKIYELKKTRELNKIIQEAKKQILEAKDKKTLEVISLVQETLKGLRQDKDKYKSIFRGLLLEGLEGLDKKAKFKLKVNPLDKEIAQEVIRELEIDVQLQTEESIDGGLIFSDLEENKIVLNTFSSRLKRLESHLRQEMSRILFRE